MGSPQGGIFALGTASHAYLEFDGRDGPGLVAAVAALREPRTTMGGVNLVAGFRPELWHRNNVLLLVGLMLVIATLALKVTAGREILPFFLPYAAMPAASV